MDRVSIERMWAGREFQVQGADTEKAREEKLLVIPAGLVRRLAPPSGPRPPHEVGLYESSQPGERNIPLPIPLAPG